MLYILYYILAILEVVVVVNLRGGGQSAWTETSLLWASGAELTSAEHRTVLSVHFLSHMARLRNFKLRIALSRSVTSSTSRGWSPAVRTCRCFFFKRYKLQLKQKATQIKLQHRNKVSRSCNRSFYFLHSLVLSVVNHNDSAATLGLREGSSNTNTWTTHRNQARDTATCHGKTLKCC